MNREIKFRGICAVSKEMVLGDLIHGVGFKKGSIYILPDNENLAQVKHCDPLDGVRVLPETVGQFTGLTDKNGKDIYEGDILKHDLESIIDVLFCEGSFILNFNHKACIRHYDLLEYEIIGNIHENPELIQN